LSTKPKRAGGKVTDDRGVERRVVSIREMWKDPRINDPHFAAMVERAVRFQLTGRRTWLMVLVGVAGGIVCSVGGIFLLKYGGVRLPPGVTGGLAGMVPAIVAVVSLRHAERARAGEIARMLLTHGTCPGCSYTLSGLPTEGDGCIACPECGAAWKADRVARMPTFAAVRTSSTPRWIRAFLDGTGTGAPVIRDDSGRTVPLVSGRLRQEIRAAGPERAETLRRAASAMARHGEVYRALLFTMLILIAAVMPVSAFLLMPRPLWALASLLPAGVMGLLAVSMFRGSSGIGAKVVRREMLLRGLCPSCSMGLDGVTADGQGLVTCAECGAAWKSTAKADRTSETDPDAPAGV